MTLIGAVVILFGLLMLLLADLPRRVINQLAYARPRHWKIRTADKTLFRRTETLREHESVFYATGATTALVEGGPARSDGPTDSGLSGDLLIRPDADDMTSFPAVGESDAVGWWLASDGEWYPPEQHPDYQPVLEASEAASPLGVDSESADGLGNPPAGWYENPLGHGLRYWDGASWTEEFAARRYVTILGEPLPGEPQRVELPGWWLTSGDT